VASVRSCEKLPPCLIEPVSCEKLLPCLIEPVPASSKTDPLLAKAKPVSDSGSASVITYLRRGKTCSEAAVEREE